MDFRMTIQTGPGKHPIGLRCSPKIAEVRIDGSRMTGCIMATLAKLRHSVGQELPVVAPMYRMTGLAIFFDGGMFPEVRTTFFSMTRVAEFIDRSGFNEFLLETAMMIMAVCTLHFAFADRVMRLLGNLHANAPMTGKT